MMKNKENKENIVETIDVMVKEDNLDMTSLFQNTILSKYKFSTLRHFELEDKDGHPIKIAYCLKGERVPARSMYFERCVLEINFSDSSIKVMKNYYAYSSNSKVNSVFPISNLGNFIDEYLVQVNSEEESSESLETED